MNNDYIIDNDEPREEYHSTEEVFGSFDDFVKDCENMNPGSTGYSYNFD